MQIILIPGLGYDCQIFKNLDLKDFEVQHLNWIEPKTGEKLHEYSQRLFAKVEKSSKKTILIGHSLGGIVSQEIASGHCENYHLGKRPKFLLKQKLYKFTELMIKHCLINWLKTQILRLKMAVTFVF